MTAKDGVAWATGKSNDPIVYLGDLLGQINGKEVKKITFGLKWDSSKVTMAPGIFFTTTSGGWAAERYRLKSLRNMKMALWITLLQHRLTRSLKT